MIREVALETEFLLREQLERAAVRNATLIVLLRHTTYTLHLSARGHVHTLPWTLCPQAECRRVAVLLGDRPATPKVPAA